MRTQSTDPVSSPHAEGAASPPVGRGAEMRLFLRRWLAHPLQMGSVLPSTRFLTRAMVRAARLDLLADKDMVVELGPGTGSVTKALLEAGLPGERLVLVERDPHMCDWLLRRFPKVRVLCADAGQLDEVLAAAGIDRVARVMSSLPLNSLPGRACDAIVRAVFRVLPRENGFFVQYTYGVAAPIPHRALRLSGERVEFVPVNVPPASVWRFSHPPPM